MTSNGRLINFNESIIKKLIETIRPPIEARDQVDIDYKFENNTLEIFEIRPRWDNKEEKVQTPIVKTKLIKSRGIWKNYWMRASGKWESYEPNPEVDDLSNFFEILKEDKYGCFWG